MEKLYHLLYPMRVCLITSRAAGKDNIMAASWVFPLSFEPAMFGVSVSPKRYSFDLIRKGKAFGINIPDPALKEAVMICGTKSGKETDKFVEAKLTKEEGKHVPLIKECPVSIECEVVSEIASGDHVVFVGKAIDVKKRSGAKGLYQARDGFIEV